jgi:hypothetical protein
MFYIDVAKVDRDVAKIDRDMHMLQWLYTYVSSVCSKCFTCFRRILQVFDLDIAKADLDVAYVCNGYTHILQVYVLNILFFHTYVASVSSGC